MARRASVTITYNKKDITADIAPHLISFDYTDNESGKADDIQLTLQDREKLWLNDWKPSKGDTITAAIVVDDWYKPGETISLPCGIYEVDEIELHGPPHTVRIKAVSVPITSAARGQAKTRAWEKITLRGIAADIAASAGLSIMYTSETNPQYLRIDQLQTSDLAFLQQLCDKACVALKVTDNKIVVFDERTFEALDGVRNIDHDGGDVISYSFKNKSAGTAKAATVSYSDPLTGDTETATYEDPDMVSGTNILENEVLDGSEEFEDVEFDGEEQ